MEKNSHRMKKLKGQLEQAEKPSLREVHEWEDIFDNITDMVTIHDKDFNIIRANKAAQEKLGELFSENSDAKCYEYYHGKGQPSDTCPSCECLITGKPAVFEKFEPHLNMFVEIRAMPQFDADKEIIGSIHIVRDITEKKRAEEEREKYRSNLEATFRSVKDAIITVDRELQVIEMNDAAQESCGLMRNTIGRELNSIQTACNRKCLEALKKTIETQQPVDVYRVECMHKDSPGKVVSLSTAPLLNSQGLFSGAVMVIRDETHLNELERTFKERKQFYTIIGESEKMQRIYDLIDDLADVQTTVLISGESGTGKELVAEAIHYRGNRSNKPLVKVNCTALSENLLESELFGYVRGAFTGAEGNKIGRFQKADGGTVFLDEIGDISPRMQLRLLRVLQEKEIEMVGDSTPIKVDIRIIAATNQDLKKKVQRGEFREDLYYRLKVVEISLPPLRDKRQDIPLLVHHFIQKFNKKFKKEILDVSENVRNIFMEYNWQGNVRELRHTIEHACILCRQSVITIEHLPPEFKDTVVRQNPHVKNIAYDDPERMLKTLEKAGWNKSKAARMLGISVRTLYRKIEKFKLKEDSSS
jgi:PAS domain S-box-containing protein